MLTQPASTVRATNATAPPLVIPDIVIINSFAVARHGADFVVAIKRAQTGDVCDAVHVKSSLSINKS